MESHSSTRKKEILTFATTGMDLEGIMLSELSQRKTNTVGHPLYVEPQKDKFRKNRVVVTRG